MLKPVHAVAKSNSIQHIYNAHIRTMHYSDYFGLFVLIIDRKSELASALCSHL